MPPAVKLKDLTEELAFQPDEGSSYLNTMTGERVDLTEEDLQATEEDKPLEDFFE